MNRWKWRVNLWSVRNWTSLALLVLELLYGANLLWPRCHHQAHSLRRLLLSYTVFRVPTLPTLDIFFADVRYESSGKWCNNLIFIFFQDFSWLFHHHGSFHPTLLVVIVISCELISHWANAWQSAETPDRPIVIKWPRTISNGFGIDQETELVSNRSNSTVYDYII